jgi:hypothetical protein
MAWIPTLPLRILTLITTGVRRTLIIPISRRVEGFVIWQPIGCVVSRLYGHLVGRVWPVIFLRSVERIVGIEADGWTRVIE